MKTILLIASISLGILFPITHSFSFLIKYLLMSMLFFSFLKMSVNRSHIEKSHFYILLFNVLVPLLFYFAISPFNLELSQVVFITAIAPTAVATPIIINLLNGKMEFTAISIIVTNFTIGFLLPFLLPVLINSSSEMSILDILFPVATVLLIPFFLAETIKKYSPSLLTKLRKVGNYVFYILVLNINLGTSKASYYIQQEMSFSDPIIYQIAFFSLLLCILFFSAGKKIVPSIYSIEGGQSLGQKNNGFTVWVALTFISPLAVLGPVFYILFQNIYISWQLHNNK